MANNQIHIARIRAGVRLTAIVVSACVLLLAALPADDRGPHAFFAAPAPASAAAPTPTAAPLPAEQYTPLLASVLARPSPVKLSDGMVYLAYELSLVNATETALTIEAVEIRDPQRADAVVASLTQAEITAMLHIPGVTTPTLTIAPAQSGILPVTLSFTALDEVPGALEHWITVTAAAPTRAVPARSVERVARTEVDRTPPVVIGPPLEGGRWLAINVLDNWHHRRGFLPINGAYVVSQRFATDYLQLSAQYHVMTGDPQKNESYPQYGQRAIAVADGTVVRAQDGMPDLVPGESLPTLTAETVAGNHVVLELASGVYAFYGHFKPGSVAVQAGQRVRRGQLLGLLGNSGNSDAPHLHFHMMAGPLPLGSNGIPYAIDAFEIEGYAVGRAASDPDAVQLAPVDNPARRNEMPATGALVEFPTPVRTAPAAPG